MIEPFRAKWAGTVAPSKAGIRKPLLEVLIFKYAAL